MSRVTVTVGAVSTAVDYTLEPVPFYDLAGDRLANWTLDRGVPNNALGYDLPGNVKLTGGVLTLRGARETAPDGVTPYTSADAMAKHVRLPMFWTAEVRAKHPYGSGMWPCPFWTRALDGGAGEIDLMEQMGLEPRFKATLHGPYKPLPEPMVGKTKLWTALPNPDPADWHTWRLVKSPGKFEHYVDELKFATITRAEAVAAGIDWDGIYENPARPQYPRVTLQIGSNKAAGLPAASFTEVVMQVSSLRIWNNAA